MAVAVLPGAARVRASDWDAHVDRTGFYNSHPWVRALELAHGPSPVLAAFAGGQLQGVLPTWANTATGSLFSLTGMTQGLLSAPSQDVLWLGTRRGTANTITCTRDPVLRARVLHGLLDRARQLAEAEGFSGVVWPYLSGGDAREAAACHPGAQVVLQGADATVSVPEGGMRGMEAAARSPERIKWRRERRLFLESGGSIEWTRLSADVCARIAPLLAATRDKHGSAGGVGWMERALTAQMSSGAAVHAVVALARTRAGEITAAAVFYMHGDWLYGRYWGATARAPRNAYFVLTFYEAVDWAAAHGFRTLHLSVPASSAKIARGAQVTPLALVHLPARHTKPLARHTLARHNHHIAQRWLRYSRLPLGPAWAPWASEER
ncbi:GNAT family N-acetyltransferase [Streptomyces botrytidirepellens]|nr:GNAT family N-acetyltransferase [Streptomyces botrytidirepellens]